MSYDRPNCALDQVWDVGDKDLDLDKTNLEFEHHPSIVRKVLPLQVISGSSSKEYPPETRIEELSNEDLLPPPPRGKGLPKLTRFDVCRVVTFPLPDEGPLPATDGRLRDYRGHLMKASVDRLNTVALLCKTGALARRRK